MSDIQRIVAWLDDWLAGGGRLLFFADFDGTLAPIVPSPDEASLSTVVRDQLDMLTRSPRVHVAVLSGRDIPDLKARVGVDDAIYAGCHGLEIEGPRMSFRHPEALAQQEVLDGISRELHERAPMVAGMRVERKRFGLAVHYRHVAQDQMRRVETELARAIQQGGGRLKIFHGTQVIEVQPQVGWGKADCVLWIRDVLQREAPEPLMVVYIGDDWTDENAFEALAGQGITVRVGAGVPTSRASYRLPDVAEVHDLVGELAARAAGKAA